jgi:hypothetical protein
MPRRRRPVIPAWKGIPAVPTSLIADDDPDQDYLDWLQTTLVDEDDTDEQDDPNR